MTFAASNAKTSGKKPVWLYRFTVGSSVWHVTRRASSLFNTPAHVTSAGQPDASFAGSTNWSPMPIETGRLDQSSEAVRQQFEISIPTQSALGQAILAHKNLTLIEVKVWQTYLDDPDQEYVVRFQGRVERRQPGLIVTKLVCGSSLSELKYQANPPIIQRACRHVHYFTPADANEAGCRLDPAPFKVNATTNLIISPYRLKVPAAGTDGSYTYGLLFHDGDEFFIEEHSGNELTLDRAISGVAPFVTTFQIAPGCDGSMARCQFFSNTLNHGGFPHITETPWTGWSID